MTNPLLIDADITLFRAAAACEREVRWDDSNHVLASNLEECWDAVEAQLTSYKEALGSDRMYMALSGGNNFRRKLWDGYKGGRSRKPLCYSALRERLTERYLCKHVDGLEADDLLGIWATMGPSRTPSL